MFYVRYLQSPLKSLSEFKDSRYQAAIERLYKSYFNYAIISHLFYTTRYLRNQGGQIERYLKRRLRRGLIELIHLYAKRYHVNGQALMQDNHLFQKDFFKNFNVFKNIVKQLQIIHGYPNFESLRRSKYAKFIIFSFGARNWAKCQKGFKNNVSRKLPLHIKIKLLHIPLAKHARVKLAPLRKGHKHYMYWFSAIRGRWHRENKHHPFGPLGSVILKRIRYQGEVITNHLWVYGNKNLEDILSMPRGTYFKFQGWVAKYLKHGNSCYDYRINHIRNAKVIKKE